MVKPEKLDHLHLVYHFAVPLKTCLQDIFQRRLQEDVFKTSLKTSLRHFQHVFTKTNDCWDGLSKSSLSLLLDYLTSRK